MLHLTTLLFVSPVLEDPVSTRALVWADLNGDGLVDAVALDDHGAVRVLENTGSGSFYDRTIEAGLDSISGVHQVAVADADGDRRADLYLAAWEGPSQLFLQSENGTFTDATRDAGLPHDAAPIDATWLDLDGDSFADLWLTTWSEDRVFRGVGAGQFEELTLPTQVRTLPAPASVEEARAMRGLTSALPGGAGTALGASSGGFSVASVTGAPASQAFMPPFCLPGVDDQAFPGNCIGASSVPTHGSLYPISNEWFIDAGTGYVGIGTTSPSYELDVAGDLRVAGQLRSEVGSGTAPLFVNSNSWVRDLNVDMLDGFQAVDFALLPVDVSALANNSVTTPKIANDAVTADKLAEGSVSSAAILNNSITYLDLQADSVGTSEIATGAVLTENIAAGAVVNAHIQPAAAIDGTKINPDFGSQNVSTFGWVYSSLGFLGRAWLPIGTNTDPGMRFDVAGEVAGLTSPYINTIGFVTDSVTQMYLNEEGQLSLGTSNPAYNARVFAVQSATSTATTAALVGRNTGSTVVPTGILGESTDEAGVGIYGNALSTSGVTRGVAGQSLSPNGFGIWGWSTSTGTGVRGESSNGLGVSGFGFDGVRGDTLSWGGTGVMGRGMLTTNYSDGVRGEATHASGYGVWGRNLAGGTGVSSTGDITATGTKHFLQPHPSDPARVVSFVCLEGNEAGTYFRGSSEIVEGFAVIPVPEEFRFVTDPEGITVQVTARGRGQLWVESVDLETVVVAGDGDIEFDYFVNGVRRGYQDLEPYRENRAFRPMERGVAYGGFLPPELRQLLVDNGTLNEDFTPNEDTAARLGWILSEPEEESLPTPALIDTEVETFQPRERE